MLWVLLDICLLVLSVSAVVLIITDYFDAGMSLVVVSVLGLTIVILSLITIGNHVISSRVIDSKIAMYQEENASIERSVAVVVEDYMIHENALYNKAKVESPIMLAQTYPELKSNELCQQLINVYIENNEKIKSLKEDKINGSVYRWWLYFGR